MKIDKKKILKGTSYLFLFGGFILNSISGGIQETIDKQEQNEMIEKIGKQMADEIKKEL